MSEQPEYLIRCIRRWNTETLFVFITEVQKLRSWILVLLLVLMPTLRTNVCGNLSVQFVVEHGTIYLFIILALRSLNDVEKKYLNLQIKHEQLETELFEKNEEFTRLSTASKNLYKEYETLKNQYETETRAMSG